MGITFGYKPEKEIAPSWATHMIMTDNDPEIWYFANKQDGRYFVYAEDDAMMKEPHYMFTDHSIVWGGIHPVE